MNIENKKSSFKISIKTKEQSDLSSSFLQEFKDLGLCEVTWDFPLELTFDDTKMSLQFSEFDNDVRYQLYWLKDYANLLNEKLSVRHEMLGRAIFPQSIKANMKEEWVVIDATCGTGADTLFLLALGFKVIAFEINPLLFLFLKHQERLLKSVYSNISLEIHLGDFKNYISKKCFADCFYFDPMYDQGEMSKVKDRKARPRKEIIALDHILANRNLHPSSGNSKLDLEFALAQNFKRVVVKRPIKGREIQKGVNSTFKGKSTRFDLYVTGRKDSKEV